MRVLTIAGPAFGLLLAVAALVSNATATAEHLQEGTPSAHQGVAEAPACAVTVPNGRGTSGEGDGGNHGNEALATALWPGGRVEFKPGGPGCVEPDGYLGMKWPWWRGVPGALKIEGRRLDGSAGPLRAHIPNGYGNAGFQSTGLLFAGPGCWEVTGRIGDATLSFVTLVVKIEDGPGSRCKALFGGFQSSARTTTQERP